MAPKKNKAASNPFFFFMLHVQQTRAGKKISLEEASRIAGPIWEKMNAAQRAPFKQLANEAKNQKGAGEKYTSEGRSYTEIEQEKNLEQQKIEYMKNSISSCVQMAVNNDTLKQQNFYFIDINIFCYITSTKEYIPAELAVSKFNFEQGVYDTFHTLINPEMLPTGYTYEAKATADETHQLPLPPDSLGEVNKGIVLGRLVEFLFNDAVGDVIPCLYTLPKNMEIVEGVLKQFCEDEGANIQFNVFSLPALFMYLMNATTTDIFDSPTVAEIQLEKDVYDYYKGLACEFHETTDVIHMCSLSRVKRWGFIIADYCCHHLGIELIPGFHVPAQAAVNKSNLTSRCSSRAESLRSTSTVRTLPRPLSPCSSVGTSVNNSVRANSVQTENGYANGAIRRATYRPASPTDSLVSSTSRLTLESNDDFPPLGSTASSRNRQTVEQIRRPKTQSQVASVASTTAASLLGLSTTDASEDEIGWTTTSRNRQQAKGRGRGIAARFSNA